MRRKVNINQWFKKTNEDYYGGTLMMLIGCGAVARGIDYHIGTLTQMGPGYYPVGVGVLLALVGAAIALQASRSAPAVERAEQAPEWRGWLCIVSSLIAFVVLGEYGGLLPATFAIVFISALGDRQNTLKSALVLSLSMVMVCLIVFWWALEIQFPLFRWG